MLFTSTFLFLLCTLFINFNNFKLALYKIYFKTSTTLTSTTISSRNGHDDKNTFSYKLLEDKKCFNLTGAVLCVGEIYSLLSIIT